MVRRIGWYLLAFLKEFKEETAKLLIGQYLKPGETEAGRCDFLAPE